MHRVGMQTQNTSYLWYLMCLEFVSMFVYVYVYNQNDYTIIHIFEDHGRRKV